MNNKKYFLILFFLLTCVYSFSQTLDNVQFPSNIKWKQIETKYFVLIFPEELSDQAKDFATLVDACYPADSMSLGVKAKKKWPIIINNTLSESNGYVASAPEFSELYSITPQTGFLGSGTWFPALCSHEIRHIMQNEKIQRGFTAFSGWIFGNYGTSITSHFALPSWVWEGDAVLTETLLSSQGRGRMAQFERGLRTNTLNGVRSGYDKSSLGTYGSYNKRVQSWYVMGYHLTTYIRQNYGIDGYNKILEISGNFSCMPLILNIAVKHVTGKSLKLMAYMRNFLIFQEFSHV
ncbi:MAG: hypothetical protein PQJ46_11680, partial [Spirochaetales bacterium]|nr:hypothetical protein [Spirochaetales bacterium]